MKKITLIVLVALSQVALADNIHVDITAPTAWSDGSLVQAGDVMNYHITRDCAGDIAEVYTDKTTHMFDNVPDGDCTISAEAVGQDGKLGQTVSVAVVTGLLLGPPGLNATVDTGTSLADILTACEANPNCTSVIVSP